MSGLRIAALALALLALPLPVPVLAGDFEDGMQFVLAKDYAKAVESFKKAAAQGNADAQFNLGVHIFARPGCSPGLRTGCELVSQGGGAGRYSGTIDVGLHIS